MTTAPRRVVGWRISPEVRDAVTESARRSGRSASKEAEHLIQFALEMESEPRDDQQSATTFVMTPLTADGMRDTDRTMFVTAPQWFVDTFVETTDTLRGYQPITEESTNAEG